MGSVVISLDAELGWGFHHLDPLPDDRIRRGRLAWHRLLDVLDEFDLPATWAVVGHLLRDAQAGPTDYADHPAGDSPDEFGATALSPENLWFGRDLVESVRNARQEHEIGCHGYTHVHFEHEAMSRGFARRELAAAVDAADALDIDVRSFVFPVNVVGYRDLLAEFGFECYRGGTPARTWRERQTARLRKLGSATVGRPGPAVHEPRVDEYGLVDVPASLYLYAFRGPMRSAVSVVARDPLVEHAKRGVELAATSEDVFHVWLHPHDVQSAAALAPLRELFACVNRFRDSHGLRVETMGDVADRVRRRS